MVSGDHLSKVKLFKYPSPKNNSRFKAYKGHSDEVLNVRFSNDDAFLFSVGGADKAILQFELVKHKSVS